MTTAAADSAVSSSREEEGEREEGLANSIIHLRISSATPLSSSLDFPPLSAPSSSAASAPPPPLSLLDLPTHVLALCVRALPTGKDVANAALSSRALRDALEDVLLSSKSSSRRRRGPPPSGPGAASEGGERGEGGEAPFSYPSSSLPGVRSLDLRCPLPADAAKGAAFAAAHCPLLRTLRFGARCPLPRGSLAAWAASEGSSFPFPPLEDVSFFHEQRGKRRRRRRRSTRRSSSSSEDDEEDSDGDEEDSDDNDEEEDSDREGAAARRAPALSSPPPGEVALFLRAAAPTLRRLDLGQGPTAPKLGGAVAGALRGAPGLRSLRARSVGSDVLAPLAEAFLLGSGEGGEAPGALPALRSLDLRAFSPAALSAGASLRVLAPGVTRLRLRLAAGGGLSVGLASGVFPEAWTAPRTEERRGGGRGGREGEEEEAEGGGDDGGAGGGDRGDDGAADRKSVV